MAKQEEFSKKMAFFLFEGNTEELFYKSIINKYIKRTIRRKYKNLEGGSGINRDVARHAAAILNDYTDTIIYIYVFIDREGSRTKQPEFNDKDIIKALSKYYDTSRIVRIAKIEAIKMIESWFFYDLEGICKYIDLPCSKSVQACYCNPEKYSHVDLNILFQKGNKKRRYKKGDEDFLRCLDIDKIYMNCKELHEGIALINDDFS